MPTCRMSKYQLNKPGKKLYTCCGGSRPSDGGGGLVIQTLRYKGKDLDSFGPKVKGGRGEGGGGRVPGSTTDM